MPLPESSERLWREIAATLPAEYEEAATAFLVEEGAAGVWVEPAGSRIRLRVFFPPEAPSKADAIERGFCDRGMKGVEIASALLPEEAWQTAWQRHSVPVQRIGRRLLIGAPWHFPLSNPDRRKVIQISPEMAFGTGTHATTRSCLLLLDRLVPGRRRGRLLDVGTGSGILAIAAAKLGVEAVTAVEIDPAALSAAGKNARVNGVASRIAFRETIPSRGRYRWGLANLTGPLLVSLADSLGDRILPGGTLILSGMMAAERSEIIARYRARFVVVKKIRRGEWITLQMERKRE